MAVVHAQHRLDVGVHVPPRQKLADDRTDDRSAAHAAADQDAHANLAVRRAAQIQADVVKRRRCPVFRRTGYRDLELAREEGELGMKRGPLPQNFAKRTRVKQFIGCHAGELIGSDIAHAIATGLNGVHFDASQIGEDVRGILQPGPVVLDVLAGGEMSIAAVIASRNVREHAQLRRRQQAIGNGHAQHRRMTLDVQAILQTQWPELVLAQVAGEKTAHLIAVLRDAFVDDGAINLIVDVHDDVYTFGNLYAQRWKISSVGK